MTETNLPTIDNVTGRFIINLNSKYNSNYCISKIYVKDGTTLPIDVMNKCRKGRGWEITVVGYNLPTSKAKYYGTWETSKYGKQFKASTFEYVTPDTAQGMISFLSSKVFKGIGKSLATAIVQEFGKNTLDIIKKNPNKLLTVRGVSVKKLNTIVSVLKSTEFYNKLAVFLGTYGDVESNKIQKIANALGSEAVNSVKRNPYCILHVDGIGFTTADNVAKAMTHAMTSKSEIKEMLSSYDRIKGATIYTLKEDSARTGGTYSLYGDTFNTVKHVLNDGLPFEVVSTDELNEAFGKMIANHSIINFGVTGKNCLFTVESNSAERDTARSLIRLQKNGINDATKKSYCAAFAKLSKSAKFAYSKDQKEAIIKILENRVCIFNGGPGTGKSTCLKAIIDCYKAVHGESATVIQVAPTGKAARRMTESTGLPADTIHRTCGIFNSHDLMKNQAELPQGLIICDEMSMVDQAVMRVLTTSIKSLNSKFVMVGDADQLPSVGAGAVLRELINSKVIPCANLTENHRQAEGAGIIIENARKINSGNTDLIYNEERFNMIESHDDEDAWKQILKTYETECKTYGSDNVVILCPRRHKVRISVDRINADLQNIVNPKYSGDMSVTVNKQEFRVRDRIIQMKNTTDASNGDVGTITAINNEDDGIMVSIRFEDGNTYQYDIDAMMNVDLAYALTIHKSQGSEYDSVIMPFLSSQKCKLFQRNLLYTGVTRAKEKVTIIGDKQAVDYCIKTNEQVNRNTLLAERLKSQSKKA